MDEAAFKRLISGETTGPAAAVARLGLKCLSVGYSVASRCRNALFDWGVKKQHPVSVPVISVGNLTTGGTGKTPIVAWIVNALVDRGHHPVILSRGYRSLDGEANDEKLVLDQLCPGIAHLQNPDRVTAARQAIAEHGANVLVLDDGFQHRRIARDLNIVLIDATCPFGFGHPLPRGLLRESITSLSRADLVLITRSDQCDVTALAKIHAQCERVNSSVPVLPVTFGPVHLLNRRGQTTPFEVLAGKAVGSFCAIGNPVGFQMTLQSLGIQPAFGQTFPDHHHYGQNDIEQLKAASAQANAQILLTTQKDLVKLKTDTIGDADVYAVEIAADFGPHADQVHALLPRTTKRSAVTTTNTK